MFFQCLETITANDRRELAALGVDTSRISEWKARKRLPTRAQALALSKVKQLDFDALERELTLLETEHNAHKNTGYATLLAHFKRTWRYT